MAFGGFDVLHLGHVQFLKEAKKKGDELVVVVARDRVLRHVKHHEPYFKEAERLELLSSLKCVDRAILGDQHNTLLPIKWERPQVIVLGYDQPKRIPELRRELLAMGIRIEKIVRAKPYGTRRHKSKKVKHYFERFV